MAIALRLYRWRRVALLSVASVLLHYQAASWLDGQGTTPLLPARVIPVRVMAELLVPDKPAAVAPEPQRMSAPRKAPVKASAAAPVRHVESGGRAGVAPRYRASPPPSAELTLDVARVDAQGGYWSGEAVMAWRRHGPAYRLQYSSGVGDMESEGKVGAVGIIPRTMTEKRGSRARTATHFDESGDITFSAAQTAVPMQAGAQDKATLSMQLAAIARADPAQLAAGVAFLVGAERDASVYRFEVLGQEEIETGIGTLSTWRLARVVQPGTYNARMDIWLAPAHEWYPVQLRSTEANGTVTTQTVSKIVARDAGN